MPRGKTDRLEKPAPPSPELDTFADIALDAIKAAQAYQRADAWARYPGKPYGQTE